MWPCSCAPCWQPTCSGMSRSRCRRLFGSCLRLYSARLRQMWKAAAWRDAVPAQPQPGGRGNSTCLIAASDVRSSTPMPEMLNLHRDSNHHVAIQTQAKAQRTSPTRRSDYFKCFGIALVSIHLPDICHAILNSCLHPCLLERDGKTALLLSVHNAGCCRQLQRDLLHSQLQRQHPGVAAQIPGALQRGRIASHQHRTAG
jgi:hypothetical protein